MKYDITTILEIAITVVSAILTGFVIPFVRSRLSAEKNEKLEFWIRTAVKAAAQLFKNSVISFIQKNLDIDAMVQAAVDGIERVQVNL